MYPAPDHPHLQLFVPRRRAAPESDAPPSTGLSPGLSVIVPVYNSAGTLRELVTRLRPVLDGIDGPHEIVLVNDGSRDNSWGVIESLCREFTTVRGIDLMRNQGQEAALLCGIRAAAFDTAAVIDDDLQNPPEEIPRLLDKLWEGLDVVYGTPHEEQHGLWRDLASVVTKVVLRSAMGAKHARDVTAFKVFRTQLRDAFADYGSPHVSIDVLLTWGTQRFGAIKVRHDPRSVGRSQYTFRKLVNHAINMATGFSVVPLQVASLTGLAFSLVGFALLIYVLVDYLLYGNPVPGFPFLASLVALFSGAQMFALGIIGEYLARVYMASTGRRPYTVRRSIGGAAGRKDRSTDVAAEERGERAAVAARDGS